MVTKEFAHTVLKSSELVICHLVASLMKRWLSGTYQGAVRPRHLDYYLVDPRPNEYTFRFNRRTSASRWKLFPRLVQQAAMTAPLLGRDIVGGKSFADSSQVFDDANCEEEDF